MTPHELAQRVMAMTGPDREVDAHIWRIGDPGAYTKCEASARAMGNRDWSDDERSSNARRVLRRHAPRYTASMDAAMGLAKGLAVRLNIAEDGIATAIVGDAGSDQNATAFNAASALTASCLLAMAENERNTDDYNPE